MWLLRTYARLSSKWQKLPSEKEILSLLDLPDKLCWDQAGCNKTYVDHADLGSKSHEVPEE